MNIQVLMKAAVFTSSFLMLLFCRDLFVMALIGVHYMYINLHAMPEQIVLTLALQSMALAVISLVLTGAVMAAGITLWKKVDRM